MLIPMIDGGIENIEQDNWSRGGCETCDYGSRYVNEIDFILTKSKFRVVVEEMYEYGLSDGALMKIMFDGQQEIQNMKEEDFAKWIEKEIKAVTYADVQIKGGF